MFRHRLVDFDPHGNDTLVFIHIQKTGGSTFVEHLHTLKEDGIDLCEHVGPMENLQLSICIDVLDIGPTLIKTYGCLQKQHFRFLGYVACIHLMLLTITACPDSQRNL